MTRADELAAALELVEARLGRACAAAGRTRAAVRLVAVTKTYPVTDIALLRDLGVADVGESRAEELVRKAEELGDGARRLTWHAVGQVQSRKAADVAAVADVVHSVDRVRLVGALEAGAERAQRAVRCLVQVSLDGDPARGGATPDEVPRVAAAVAEADHLELRGVMAVAPLGAPAGPAFARLAEVAAALRAEHPGAVEVSAGMSGDLEEAVAAGATLVRVGTALLGQRPPLLR